MSIARLDWWFEDYRAYHKTAGNKVLHRIGIPLILFSLLGMLSQFDLFTLRGFTFDLGGLLIVLAGLFYLMVDSRMGWAMIAVSTLLYWIAAAVPLPAHVAMFTGGWILQFIGHGLYERNRPAFVRNFAHLLVGPLWVLNDLGASRIRRHR